MSCDVCRGRVRCDLRGEGICLCLTGLGGLQQTSQGGGLGGNLGLFNKPQTSLGQPGALGGTLGEYTSCDLCHVTCIV